MARKTIHVCDRCNRSIIDDNKVYYMMLYSFKKKCGEGTKEIGKYDLCKHCREGFKHWFEKTNSDPFVAQDTDLEREIEEAMEDIRKSCGVSVVPFPPAEHYKMTSNFYCFNCKKYVDAVVDPGIKAQCPICGIYKNY